MTVLFSDRVFPLTELAKATVDCVELKDGTRLSIHSMRPVQETAALCDLINDAAAALSAGETTPATRVDWGVPPIRAAEYAPIAAPMPDWALSGMHETRFEVRHGFRWVYQSGYLFFAVMTLGPLMGFLLASVLLGGTTWWALALAPAYLTLLIAVPLLRRGPSEAIHVDGGAITFERKLGPFVYRRRSMSLDDVQGVSSAGDCLVFYLGERVLPLVCHRPPEEVEALALHLNRLVTVTPESDSAEPPIELRRVVRRGTVRN